MLFRRRGDAEQPATGSVWLDEFFDALKHALLGANRVVRDQYIDSLGDLYDLAPSGNDSENLPTYVPKTIRMRIPTPVLPASGTAPPLDVPLPALTQNDALVLDEFSFDLDCRVVRYEDGKDGTPGRVAIRLNREGAGSPARVSLKYKTGDPPEAIARINDALLRTFS